MPSLNESDRHIVDSIGGLLDDAGGLKRVRKLQGTPLSFDRALWARLASLGWLGASVPDPQGGTGLSLSEIALLLEHAGKRLLPEPLVQALGGARLLARCGAPAADLLASAIAGKTLCVLADGEGGATLAADAELSGRTGYICDGHLGDAFLVLAERGGRPALCALARNAKGVSLESEETVDGGSIARLRLDRVGAAALTVLLEGPDAAAAFAEAQDLMRIGYSALLLGLMDEALQMTVAYLKDRRQFGVPIGSFQALQHRAASLYVVIKATHALLYEACRAGPERRRVAALGLKAYAAQSAMQTVKECVQLHGAMGYTEEHDMSLFFRRAMTLAVAEGDAASCRKLLYAAREHIRAI
ncbi:MAG: acyl-CoA dehydrogenase family protein [Stellaceae bacterium]